MIGEEKEEETGEETARRSLFMDRFASADRSINGFPDAQQQKLMKEKDKQELEKTCRKELDCRAPPRELQGVVAGSKKKGSSSNKKKGHTRLQMSRNHMPGNLIQEKKKLGLHGRTPS